MKKIVAYDDAGNVRYKEKASFIRHNKFDTDIAIRSLDTGEVIAKHLKNKVVLPGAGFIARSLFDISTAEVSPSYNTALGLDNISSGSAPDFTAATAEHPKVLLFCIGTDGCGTEGSQVFTVDYNSWIAPEAIVPFRYPLTSNDLSAELRESYFGRKEDGDYAAYYFKRFTSGPDLHQQYIDGTPIDSNVLNTGEDVETYVEVVLTITKDDCRDFFIATTGIDECRFNSISLCYAYPLIADDGYTYFNDIHPLTRLNIPNEYLIDITKGVEIIYHIYM